MGTLDGLKIFRVADVEGAEAHDAKQIAGFKTGMHFHEEIQLMVVLSGERLIEHNRGRARLAAGDSLIVPPFEPHRGSSLGASTASFKTIYLPMQPQFKEQGTTCCSTAPIRMREPEIGRCIEALVDQLPDRKKGMEVPEPLAQLLCQVLFPRRERLERRSNSLDRVRIALENSIETRPCIESIAQTIGISKFHMVRCFKSEFGLSPYAYNIRHRINRAKSMLASGAAVSNVALDLGFYDQSHFGLHFRLLTGLPPAVYQRKVADV